MLNCRKSSSYHQLDHPRELVGVQLPASEDPLRGSVDLILLVLVLEPVTVEQDVSGLPETLWRVARLILVERQSVNLSDWCGRVEGLNAGSGSKKCFRTCLSENCRCRRDLTN